jgi:hypothetical protein
MGPRLHSSRAGAVVTATHYGLQPRGLSREQAARYLRVSPERFDMLVLCRKIPAPKRIDEIRIWDRYTLTIDEDANAVGGVYFAGFAEYVKIGWSTNVNARLRELQTGAPERLRLYTVLPGIRDKEKDTHRRFAHLRLQGEWFRRAPDLVEFMEQVKAGVA